MAPKANAMSLLFHPKKKRQNQPNQTQRPAGTNGARPQDASSSPKPTVPGPAKEKARAATAAGVDDDEVFNLPNTPYSEFRILSSKLQGWKYDVMKFDSRKPVDIMRWTPPIKLNRKDIRKDDAANSASAVPQAVGPMLGPDGKPVIGVDGKMVMVDAEGKPIHHGEHGYGGGMGASGSKDKGKGKDGPGRKRFQKKTRQVFLVPDEVRQLRKEERYPWVMEDSAPHKTEPWIGHLEEVSKAETHGFFMPAANDAFKFVPAHRWYKFQKKIKRDFGEDMDTEEMWTKGHKKDPTAWLAQLNGGKGASSATAALFKQEAEGKPRITEGQSLGPGGRKLKTVDSGANLFGDDDEDREARRRREKELGGEGDIDEQVYEEDFADDEEAMNVDENVDEEQKEIEERLKREYQRANKQNETGIDVEDEEEGMTPKNKQQKALEKMIKKREGNTVYESDDDENPYASSQEEEEEPEPVHTGPAIQPQPQQVPPSKPASPMPGLSKPPTATNSRAASPVSPGLGGHSLVAKRATSPNAQKARIPGTSGSGGNSPTGSRANSPTPSRATSPLANPPANGEVRKSVKRKAEDSPTSSAEGEQKPPPKKKKSITPEDLETKVVAWIKGRETATTRECIAAFNVYMDEKTKPEFLRIVKRVAILTADKVLVLRPDYAKKTE